MGKLLLLVAGLGAGVAAAVYRSAREMRTTPGALEASARDTLAEAPTSAAAPVPATGARFEGRP